MSLLLAVPLLAAIGGAQAALWALFLRAVNRDQIFFAAMLDALLTSFSFIAWSVMMQTGHDSTPPGIAAYALGGATGTYLGLRKKKGNG